MRNSKKVYGIGIADISTLNEDGSQLKCYSLWKAMMSRCYSDKVHAIRPTYVDCSVVHEWTVLSVFKEWFDANYIPGFHLDKDILCEGNKIYCPEYCVFVPAEINTLIGGKTQKGGGIVGTSLVQSGNYTASIRKNGVKFNLGTYASQSEAFNVYKHNKELYIKEVAFRHYGLGNIGFSVFNALVDYEIKA